MKKIILILISILFSVSAFGQLSDAYQAGKEKVVNFVKPESERGCPIYGNTPIASVKRPAWEATAGFNFMYSPNNGDMQFRTDSWSLGLIHNLSSVLGAFVRYDTLKFKKTNYENSEYDPDWEGYNIVAGLHLYVTPVIRFYGGFGYLELCDFDGNCPDYDTTTELGVKFDIPLEKWGYKVVASYKVVDAPLAEENTEAKDALADGSYNAVSLSISIPFGY